MISFRRRVSVLLVLLAPAVVLAQEEAEPDPIAQMKSDLEKLDTKLAELQKQLDEQPEAPLSGWQVQLRGGYFNLAHNHRKDLLAGGSSANDGWTAGISFVAPLWPELGPIDLAATLEITYRQINHRFNSPVVPALGGPVQTGTISYLNVVIMPTIRIPVTDTITPFINLGVNIQVASPTSDDITYLDLGAVLGFGLDFKVSERISVGFDLKYTWFGVADQEDEDYGNLGLYLGFNF